MELNVVSIDFNVELALNNVEISELNVAKARFNV